MSWSNVLPVWKDETGSHLSTAVLEAAFPSDRSKKEERKRLWRELDANGNAFVSLAEFDSWFETAVLRVERAQGARGGTDQRGTLWRWARPCLIRAFVLASNVAKKESPPSTAAHDGIVVFDGAALDPQDFITSDEFCMLLLATQCCLKIMRVFDVADVSHDRRISRQEWSNQLGAINKELRHYSRVGKAVQASDFAEIDTDNQGMVLLDEAVHFFLSRLVTNPTLLAENNGRVVGFVPDGADKVPRSRRPTGFPTLLVEDDDQMVGVVPDAPAKAPRTRRATGANVRLPAKTRFCQIS